MWRKATELKGAATAAAMTMAMDGDGMYGVQWQLSWMRTA